MNRRVACRVKFIMIVCSTIMLVCLSKASMLAQAHSGYLSGVQLANLSASDAQVILTLYNDNGEVISTTTDLIAANGTKTYFPVSEVLGSGCTGRVQGIMGAEPVASSTFIFPRAGCTLVVTSDQELSATVNLVSADFRAGGSYIYERTGATTVYLPLLNKDNSGFNTWFTVQNLGPDTANIQVRYSDGVEVTAVIPQGRAHTFYQAQESHTQKVFAGVVTSDQPVFVSVVQEDTNLIFSYGGFTSGATDLVFPLININNAGYITGLQIQNIGEQPTTVEVTYTPAFVGIPCTETQMIGPGLSTTFALAAFDSGANSDCEPGQRFVGSARVTGNSANQPLVGIGNQLLPGRNGSAYRAFDPSQATHKVVMPLIMDRNSGFFTGFSLQNVGSEVTTVQCTFANITDYTVSAQLAPGESLNDIQQNKLLEAYVGGATCTADSTTAKIVAVVNELGLQPDVDHLLTYEGVFSP